jgi:LuxR family maltose regulon positive regulatory protein
MGLSFVYLFSGDLYALEKIVEQHKVLSAANQSSLPAAYWIAGIAGYEANRLQETREAWQITTDLHFVTNFFAASDSWLGLARICQIQGDFEQAQEHIDAVRAEGISLECTELLPIIEGMQAFQWHLQGKTAMAQRWALAFRPEPALDNINLSFLPVFYWVRILVTHGNQDAIFSARKTLKQKLAAAQNRHNIRQQIQLLSHLALIDDHLGNQEAAAGALIEAVDLAKLGGFIRSIIDAGPELRSYLQEIQDQASSPHPHIVQLLSAYRSNGIGSDKPLTSREKEILTMMQAGLSNGEIAQNLVISLYTVKRHASNIYRKLDVAGRRQAIDKAEQMGTLS